MPDDDLTPKLEAFLQRETGATRVAGTGVAALLVAVIVYYFRGYYLELRGGELRRVRYHLLPTQTIQLTALAGVFVRRNGGIFHAERIQFESDRKIIKLMWRSQKYGLPWPAQGLRELVEALELRGVFIDEPVKTYLARK